MHILFQSSFGYKTQNTEPIQADRRSYESLNIEDQQGMFKWAWKILLNAYGGKQNAEKNTYISI